MYIHKYNIYLWFCFRFIYTTWIYSSYYILLHTIMYLIQNMVPQSSSDAPALYVCEIVSEHMFANMFASMFKNMFTKSGGTGHARRTILRL